VESYSAFYDKFRREETPLLAALCGQKITDVFVCGLATDICVGEVAKNVNAE